MDRGFRRAFAALSATLLLAAARAHAVRITEFPIPTAASNPMMIASGPDGRLWFCENEGDKVGAITTAGAVTEYPIRASSGCYGIAAAAGALWYTEQFTGKLGTMTTSGATSDGGSFADPLGIADGRDGRVWFAQFDGTSVEAFQVRANGPPTTAYPVPTLAEASQVAVGPDGNVWVTESHTDKLALCFTGTTTCNQIALASLSGPAGITTGPDGNVWFTEYGANKIGRFVYYGPFAGSIDEFPIPSAASHPFAIASGPDGNLWFTEFQTGKIGRITPSGVITEFPTPSNSTVKGIVLGPDGNLWFTEASANKIGRLEVEVPGDVNADGLVNVADVFYLVNFLFAGGPAPK